MRRLVLASLSALLTALLVVAPASARERSKCPPRYSATLAASDPRAADILAPRGAIHARICVDDFDNAPPGLVEARVLRRQSAVRQLTRRLNALPRAIEDADFGRGACPADAGPRFVVILAYERGRSVGIRVDSAGCRVVENRYLGTHAPRRGVGTALLNLLRRYVPRRADLPDTAVP